MEYILPQYLIHGDRNKSHGIGTVDRRQCKPVDQHLRNLLFVRKLTADQSQQFPVWGVLSLWNVQNATFMPQSSAM